ncbi:MAG TPA: GntR family transcriptional regulator [Humisphaera sp.]
MSEPGPRYQQLNDALRALVRRSYADGQRFLTERDVAERFGVSRPTANKALSSLVGEGLLEFRKGVGTFVRGGLLDYDLRALVSFTDKARAAGQTPGTKVLAFERLAPGDVPADVARDLGLNAGQSVYYVERLRLADRRPVILERRHVSAVLCPRLSRRDVGSSLYALWSEQYGLAIADATETIRAVSLGRAEAKLLGAPAGSAALLVSAVGRVAGGAPLWVERTLYRGDAYEFRNTLGPVQTARPAAGVLRVSTDATVRTRGRRRTAG